MDHRKQVFSGMSMAVSFFVPWGQHTVARRACCVTLRSVCTLRVGARWCLRVLGDHPEPALLGGSGHGSGQQDQKPVVRVCLQHSGPIQRPHRSSPASCKVQGRGSDTLVCTGVIRAAELWDPMGGARLPGVLARSGPADLTVGVMSEVKMRCSLEAL